MPRDASAAAKPSKHLFDPFNSSATGHQRADNCLSSSKAWQDSRSNKLRIQFAADTGGGPRTSDTVGAGSLDFGRDGRTANGGWERGAKGLRTGGQRSLMETLGIAKPCNDNVDATADSAAVATLQVTRPEDDKMSARQTEVVNPFTPFRYGNGRVRETSWTAHETSPSELLEPLSPFGNTAEDSRSKAAQASCASTSEVQCHSSKDEIADHADQPDPSPSRPPQIFSSLTFYINGSTAPWSDHHVKRLLSSHGGRVSVALGRRTVTHVILGKLSRNGGSGGGLAASKVQKEITKIGGKGIRFVTADWIVESVKAGKRLPESRFEALKLAPKGVGSVATLFSKAKD